MVGAVKHVSVIQLKLLIKNAEEIVFHKVDVSVPLNWHLKC